MENCVKIRRTLDIEITGLGERIREARKADKRSLETLASAAGISRGYWYDIESESVRDALPEDTLRKIESVLGVNFDVNFKGEEE